MSWALADKVKKDDHTFNSLITVQILAILPEADEQELKRYEAFWQSKTGSLLIGMNSRVEYQSAFFKNTAIDKLIF